jgi:hypothetical protein
LGSHNTKPIHGVDVEKVDLNRGLNFCVKSGPASRAILKSLFPLGDGLFSL